MNQAKDRQTIRSRLHQLDPLFVRSEKEAAYLASSCRVSARALIMRAQANSTLPAQAWDGFYTALDAADKRAAGDWREKLKETTRSFRKVRRLAVGAAVLVLALAFFTLVPAGRAIAESIFSYVISVFDKQLQIDQTEEKALYDARGYDVPDTMPPGATYSDGELVIVSDPVFYDSVAAFEAVYSLDAFELNSDQLTCVEVSETNHVFTGKSLHAVYQTPDGKTVSVIEKWYLGDGMSISARGEIKEHQVLGDRTMTYVVDSENGSFDGIVLLNNSILQIYADAGINLDFIWDLLQ